jgi:hypothetical protein
LPEVDAMSTSSDGGYLDDLMDDLELDRRAESAVSDTDAREELTRYLANSVPLQADEKENILLWWKVSQS